MSRIVAHRPNRQRLRRAGILVAILIAAVVTVFALNAAGSASRASAESLRHASLASASSHLSPEKRHAAKLAAAQRASRAAKAKNAAAAAAAATATAQANAAAAAAQVAAQQAAASAARAAAAQADTLNVWTTGFQTEINECRGAVDVTAQYGTPTVAEHWSCGGSTFPTTAGTIITITGLDAGTYRVTGVVAVLDAYTAHTNDIPHGYSLLFQTCGNGDSHYTQFVGLQKVG